MKKKLLSVFLVLCMVLPLFSFPAQADDEVTLTNVFLGKAIDASLAYHSASYIDAKMVDGINNNSNNNRFSSKYQYTSTTPLTITVPLVTTHALSYITIYEFFNISQATTSTYSVEAGVTGEDGNVTYTPVASASNSLSNGKVVATTIQFGNFVNADTFKIVVSRTNTTKCAYMICEVEGYGFEGTYTPPAEEPIEPAEYKPLKLWYDEPAVDDDKGSTEGGSFGTSALSNGFRGWEAQALPLGNGYLGAMVFGRTDSERIQLTENSLSSTYQTSGLTNFAETYIDFNHTEADTSSYYRDLNLDEGTAHVRYTYGGVNYEREYITSHPDKVMAIKLTASEGGKVSFTLRPTIPYLHEGVANSIAKKTGTVSANGDTVTIKGVYGVYNVKYEGQFTIVPQGTGYTMTANNDANGDNGTITLSGADSAIIYIAIGTNYPLNDPTVITSANANKLDNGLTVEQLTAKLKGYIDTAKQTGYDKIRENHLADYQEYFGRVKLDLNTEVPEVTTDVLVSNYASGTYNSYLEILLFQYGRYMLICSSREGTLPANLQGIWNRYRNGVCMVGYWHNVNVQLTYWPAFVTNLTDMFKSYQDYFDTVLPQAKKLSHNLLVSEGLEADESGDSGWNFGTGGSPYWIQTGRYAFDGNDGNGCGPFLAETFWDYYRFTGDLDILEEWVYPVIRDCANYSSRVVTDTGDGLYLTRKSASPENHVNGTENYQPAKGDLYPQGTTYDQSLIYDIMNYALTGAEILKNAGRMTEDEFNTDEVLNRIRERIGKLDPIKIGTSGQIKEFREETYYAEYGQDSHRHISHLMGIYPGTIINYDTPAWQDAAKTTLPLRNSSSTDWKWAMPTRAVVWARLGGGNQAMAQMRKMMKATNGLRGNLLTGTPTFQIDGNCGSTAAFAEMLLQSHMDYIEPLAAIPDDWANGSFDGLLARGAFEVGATWEEGKLLQMRILSQKGNNCVIKYPGVGSAVVKDSAGNVVSYTKNANDEISFATTAGTSYTVSSIPAVTETAPVTELAISDTEFVLENRKTTLSWTASSNAASYNVYYAKNDAATYTLAGTTTQTSYQIPTEFSSKNDRVTYAVTAVSADGVESDRAWMSENPLGPIIDANGSINEDTGEFVITLTPTYAVDSYNIYKTNTDGEKTLVKNTTDTVITLPDASPFFEVYTVAAVEEGTEEGEKEVAFLENVALVKTVKTNIVDNGSALPVSAITDGTDKSYASHSGVAYNDEALVVEIDLADVYKVSGVMLSETWKSEYTRLQNGIVIETGLTAWNGETTWTEHTKDFMKSTANKALTIVEDEFWFDKVVSADKLRVTYNRNDYTTGTQYNVTEIEAYGIYESEKANKNIALGKTVTSNHKANGALPLTNITDGKTGTRYATTYSSPGITDMVLTMDLEELYVVGGADFWQYYLTKYAKVFTGLYIETGVTIDGTTTYTKAYDNIQFTGSNGKTGEAASVRFDDLFLADKVKFTFKIDKTGVDVVSEQISHTISEIILYGYEVENVGNIASGALVETNLAAISSIADADLIVDGDRNNAFETGVLAESSPLEITLNLDGSYNIYQVNVFELLSGTGLSAGDKVKVEVGATTYAAVKWETARENVVLASGSSLDAGSVQTNLIVLDKAYKGDKVRITIESGNGIDTDYGYKLAEIGVYGDNKKNNSSIETVKLMSGDTELDLTSDNLKSATNTLKVSYRGLTEGTAPVGLVAFYDDLGNTIKVSIGTVTDGVLSITPALSGSDTIAKIRVFIWDSVENITPVLPAFGKAIPKN